MTTKTFIGGMSNKIDGSEVGHFYIYNDPCGEYTEGQHYIRLVVFENAGCRFHTFEHFLHFGRENGDEAFGSTPMAVVGHLPEGQRAIGRDAAEAFMTREYPLLQSGELEFDPV